MKSVMITGANGGIGKDTARQFALLPETEKVYLACRNPQRAEAAKKDLEAATGRNTFEVVIMDVSDPDSVRRAVARLTEPIEGLVMNAGGMGGKDPGKLTKEGVHQMMATNVLGHAVLLEEMLEKGLLTKAAVYAGTEAARGVAMMGMAKPKLKSFSVDEFSKIIDASFWKKYDPMAAYGYVKLVGNMWMSSLARKYPNVRLVTMSPGGTAGTDIMANLPPFMKFFFENFAMKVMPAMGMFHPLEMGAKRFVDALTDPQYKTGVFYASKRNVTGAIIDQTSHFPELGNTQYQDNAREALHRFIK